MKPRVAVSWSTGKDSAWCLHVLRMAGDTEVVGLLTTVARASDRVSIHGTRRSILRKQAERVCLPVYEVEIPSPCSNDEYERATVAALAELAKDLAVDHVAFGDLFLEDVRAYRERLLEGTGVGPLFPLWGLSTRELADRMVDEGTDAVIVAAPETSAVAGLVGTRWDPSRLAPLPDVDPCGERGEFHTCVVGGPGLPAIAVEVGPTILRDGTFFADVRPGNE
jgi:uncharacterized protein (TIGR00290 family)